MKHEENIELRTERTVLVVDDEKTLRFTLTEAMRDEGYQTHEAASGTEAFGLLREENIDVVLLDLKLKESGEDGIAVLKRIKKDFPEVEVVMMTAYGKFEHAVEATRAGCFNFVGKPFQLEQIKLVVKSALHSAALRREVEILRRGVAGRFPTDQVIGQGEGLRQIMETVNKVARSRTTVLLSGETGTGKEVIARAIHKRSDVAEGPFVALNCSAVPENLLESQLFGHEKGAFTDAKFRKKGDFELADHGTLFLDEIGDMAPGLQAKLLRVLEGNGFKRLGGTGDIVVDVRVIAATHRDLKLAIAENRFREDLYFRLAVVPVHIPPLRDRRGDILSLARFFLDHMNKEMGRSVSGFSPEAEQALLEYAWPGNVRELRNVVERAVLLCGGEHIDAPALPLEVLAPMSPKAGQLTYTGMETWSLADWEKHAIAFALRICGGNKTKAAELLGIDVSTIYRRERASSR